MSASLPVFLISFLVHIAIYLTSAWPDRRLRLFAGLALLFNTYPIWFGGVTLFGSVSGAWVPVAQVLMWAPYYFPLLSFLVYIRRHGNIWR